MSEMNKAVLQHANAAARAGDCGGFLARCTDDVEWRSVGERTLSAKDAVRGYTNATYLELPPLTVAQVIAEGDLVAAIGEIAIKDATGRVALSAYCDVWCLREGKPAELRAFVIEIDAEV